MILPPTVKESETYIYCNTTDAELIKTDADFEPIQGQQSVIHGNIIGYINGKLVIVLRDL